MRAAVLTIEPVEGALRLRLERPERDTGEPLAREFRLRVEVATLRALEESASALFHPGARASFADDARRTGTILYRTLVPEALRDDLRTLRTALVVASSVTGLPWELVHDEEEFWGLRYALGTRLVLERPAATRLPVRRHERPRALVVGANPSGDLPHVAAEIDAVCTALERRADVVCVAGGLASFERVLAQLGEGFDVVHFAGHVVADETGAPALLLGDGRRLPARVVEANLAGRPLVFVNGCASATPAIAASSVAHAFLQGGALAVVGTVADVADEHAATLAATFYREALGGAPLGNALREARAEVRERAPASPAWLSVVLYGNPAHRLREEAPPAPVRAVEERPAPAAAPAPAPSRIRRWPWLVAALGVALALAVGVDRLWRGATAPGVVAVGVMDVRARGAGVPDWIRTLTRDSLNTVLARVPEVQVYSRQKIEFLREKRGLTDIEAAEALGMTKLLAASVGLEGGQVTLEVEVVDIATGVLVDTVRVQGPEAHLLDLETELALRVLTALGVQPSPEELRALVAERKDATVEAYRLLSETLGAAPRPLTPAAPSSSTTAPGPGASWLGPGTPAYAEAPDQEEVAIRDLLRRYALALESKEPDALAALQVEMDDAQRASLARYFAVATDLHVQIRDVDVLVEGDDAVVTFTREDSFTDAPSGRAMRLVVRVSGRLVKQAGAWKIKSLGDRP
jgi:hypothetical protein